MRSIRLEKITKGYNSETIVENLSLVIPGGKFFALLGPSGSGKTTLLRLIAGFETVDEGRIFLGDQDITQVPINERHINTVFQHYALFPHLNVFDNVAYGLRARHVPEEVIEQKVMKILRTVHLERYAYKSIVRLSGGQQQRVALARAVVNEPEVLLLDEPLAALDLKLRERMLIELIELQSALNTTFVYVTHDQLEALTVADNMAIMNADGYIEQIGSPKEIYEFPATTFVARFVGTTNILSGMLRAVGERSMVHIDHLGEYEVAVGRDRDWVRDGIALYLSLRPEKIDISKKKMEGFSNMFEGLVEAVIYHGRSTQYNVRVSPYHILQVFEQNEEHFPQEVIDYDDHVYLYWQKENVVLLKV